MSFESLNMEPSRADTFERAADGFFAGAAAAHWRAILFLVLLSLAFFVPGFVSLQPMDRDEPRFAQASKQMLETHDFIDIRFQEDSRYKKPVGIYWLQSAAVALGENTGVRDAKRVIALYRIPSLLGALAAVLLTYWTALAFVSRRGAFLAACLMSGCILLGVEARLAKTDGVLLATVMAVMGGLARAWFYKVSPKTTAPVSRATIILFWVAMGLSILIKGPITLMVAMLAAGVLSWREGSIRWLGVLKPRMGLLIVAAIVLPWLIMIIVKTGGAFFNEAVGKDMLGKVAGGQERHGAPPGSYFAVFWATFWPVAPLVAISVPFIWKNRRDDGILFLLAWIIPSWIVFEAVPTKLPHYVLPLYPPMAILVVMVIEAGALQLRSIWAKIVASLILLLPLLFLVGVPAAFYILDKTLPFLGLPFLALSALFAALSMRQWLAGGTYSGIASSLAAALALTIASYPFGMAQLNSINLSKRLAKAAHAIACEAPRMVTTGYREPSLIFLTSTDIMLSDGAGAARFISEPGCRIAFVEAKQEAEFLAMTSASLAVPQLYQRVDGMNINSGRKLDIGVYVKR